VKYFGWSKINNKSNSGMKEIKIKIITEYEASDFIVGMN
jgi:hypothetical protein